MDLILRLRLLTRAESGVEEESGEWVAGLRLGQEQWSWESWSSSPSAMIMNSIMTRSVIDTSYSSFVTSSLSR